MRRVLLKLCLVQKTWVRLIKIFNEAYETFKTLGPQEIAFVMGVKGYEKHAVACRDFETNKGMPVHAKSAYFYNQLLEKLGTGNKYEEISSGDKVRFMYVEDS